MNVLYLMYIFISVCLSRQWWCSHGDVQYGQVHQGLCPQLLPGGSGQKLASVPQHQKHHLEEVRWSLQRHLPGDLQEVRTLKSMQTHAHSLFYNRKYSPFYTRCSSHLRGVVHLLVCPGNTVLSLRQKASGMSTV